MSSFDWPILMRAGLRGLGISPSDFWALTPAELQMMLGDAKANAPLLSEGLDALMAAYPDQKMELDDGRR
ncbi:rcc01693 family protein [Sulfitobacter sp. SK012]|uniref:rcc01693 family protein n=1 Tax=Sulfitobacter sp. SK012 TaxID=1389005 RepID=UPI0013B39C0F|nr:rcc01693 family protein [Sulfitobacter sp. SK012]